MCRTFPKIDLYKSNIKIVNLSGYQIVKMFSDLDFMKLSLLDAIVFFVL